MADTENTEDFETDDDEEEETVLLNPRHLVLTHGKNQADALSITKLALKICRARWPRSHVKIMREATTPNYEDEAEEELVYIVETCRIPRRDLLPDSGAGFNYVDPDVQQEIITSAAAAFEIVLRIKELESELRTLELEADAKPKKGRRVTAARMDESQVDAADATEGKRRVRLPTRPED